MPRGVKKFRRISTKLQLTRCGNPREKIQARLCRRWAKWRIWQMILFHFATSAISSRCEAKGQRTENTGAEPIRQRGGVNCVDLSCSVYCRQLLLCIRPFCEGLVGNVLSGNVRFSPTDWIKYNAFPGTASLARPCADEEERLLYLRTLGGQIST